MQEVLKAMNSETEDSAEEGEQVADVEGILALHRSYARQCIQCI